MSKDGNEIIATFNFKKIWKIIRKKGFNSIPLDMQTLREISSGTKREFAECNKNIVQIVSVFIVQSEPYFLAFKKTRKSPENRLHHISSLIFGGHVKFGDLMQLSLTEDSINSPHFSTFSREFNEELKFKNPPQIKYGGIIYIDSNEISKQHVGIVYFANCKIADVSIRERSLFFKSEFLTLRDILSQKEMFDEWSYVIANSLQ